MGNGDGQQQQPTWVETKTADNKVYYYNSTTRETSWKRPENVRIVKYDQLMAAAMAAMSATAPTAVATATHAPVRYPPMATATVATVGLQGNHHYSLNGGHHQHHHPHHQHHNHNHHHHQAGAIVGIQQSGGFPSHPAAATLMTASMDPYMTATAAAAAVAGASATKTLNPSAIQVATGSPATTATNVVSSAVLPNVKAAYGAGNSPASSTVPTLAKAVGPTKIGATSSGALAIGAGTSPAGTSSLPADIKSTQLKSSAPISSSAASSSSLSAAASASAASSTSASQLRQQASGGKKEAMKPVSTTAIPGTAWCVVWTDKNKVFYFNPSTKTSVWDRPAELRNRDDVDKIISNPPPIAQKSQQHNDDAESHRNGSSGGDQQAEKKLKLDSDSNDNSSSSTTATTTTDQTATTISTLKPTIAPRIVKKEVTSEIEKEAAKKRETISFEERVETFRQMLDEKEVNPSSSFQKELSKIVFDPRYLLLTSNERRETFEKYCLEKTEEERRRRREKMKKAAESFKELLKEASLTSRSIYEDFHDKYSKDPRYRALERTKDREILFDDHLAMLRRKEREERSQSKRSERHHIKKKRAIAEENFRQLLRETKLIDKDTRRKIEESEHQHLIDIIGTLQNHKRYLDLEPYSEKRRKILLNYIEELAASNP